ncbi:MAG: hypothetical protein ACK4EX_10260 [Thermaurantimonas sp.]
MIRKNFLSICLALCGTCMPFLFKAQPVKTEVTMYDGFAMIGWLPNGGFLNFTGPNINFTFARQKLVIGMLPSLSYLRDEGGPTRNAPIIPNLSTGITYSFDWAAVQMAFYYDNKTSTQDGRWLVG